MHQSKEAFDDAGEKSYTSVVLVHAAALHCIAHKFRAVLWDPSFVLYL